MYRTKATNFIHTRRSHNNILRYKQKKQINELNGTVKWFDDSTGYGYITDPTTLLDYYVNANEIKGQEFGSLRTGDKVTFEPDDETKKRCAKNVFLKQAR